MDLITEHIKRHRSGGKNGLYSVCSSHPLVIEAAMRHCDRVESNILIIEATCNQVNQDGGYTGMTPENFVDFVAEIASRVGFNLGKLVLGGDHLGPNPWRNLDASEAMAKAGAMVREYVSAGFQKIHIDCTMACADDKLPLTDELIASRAAQLTKISESAAREKKPLYVIGSEVPVPGGAHEALDSLAPTSVQSAKYTINEHKRIFAKNDLGGALERVIALVVQPGVEFDNSQVFDFCQGKARDLSNLIIDYENMVYEAHSTDYQTRKSLSELVDGHFAILKVGPGLTFALREALWALDAVEREWISPEKRSNFKEATIEFMVQNPKYWQGYYKAEPIKLRLELQYSLSDRIRYYWPEKHIQNLQAKLFKNLDQDPPPFGLLSQYLSLALARLREQSLAINSKNLVLAHIMAVLDNYFQACNQKDKTKIGGKYECR